MRSASTRITGYAIGALGLLVLGLTLVPRVGSPWPLEWMEGASLAHALRILRRAPLYAAPSADFIAFVYPPLSYLPMALSGALFGPSLWAARLSSLIALGVALASLARTLWRETGRLELAALGVGLYALGFGYTGGFYDLARVDAWFIALVMLGAERLSAGARASGLACLVLSAFAKQHGVFFLAAGSLGLLLDAAREGRGRAQIGWLASAWLGLALGWGVLAAVSGGWFWRYTYQVPAGHGLVPVLLGSYLAVDVALYLPFLSLACLWPLVAKLRRPGRWELWLSAGLLASALGRAHPGGDDNVRWPGFAILVLVGVLGFAAASERATRARVRLALCGAACLQAAMLLQLPAAHWPTRAVEARFAELHAALEYCSAGQGGVALDYTLLGGEAFVHTMALSDLRASGDAALAGEATGALLQRLRAGSGAPLAVAISASFPELDSALERGYELCQVIPGWRMPSGYSPGTTRVWRKRVGERPQPLEGAGLLWR